MSIGNLRTEGDLQRFIQAELRRPGSLPVVKAPIALVKNGVPTDADFPNTPSDGILALDKEAKILYARANGEWMAV